MPLSTAQRSQINRQNAAQSTGPKTEEGKARSRRNALKHGLRAEALDLPNEIPGAFEALADEWHEYYQPDSPGEVALVDRAVHATIQLQRCARFQAEAVGKRVREAEALWDRQREEDIARLDAALWGDDPAPAVAALKATADGCALLLNDWEALQEALDRHGRWEPAERDRALRLCGQHPDKFDANPLAFLLRYYNLYTLVSPNPEMVTYLMDAKRIPPQLRGTFTATRPMPDESREALRELVAHEVHALKARQGRLQVLDEADRAGAAERALLLDGPEGALLLRYEKMHDGSFHRAYSALLKGRKEKAAEAPIEPKPAAPIEPKPEPKAVAPIEPKPAATQDANTDDSVSSGEPAVLVLPVAAVEFEAAAVASGGVGLAPMAF